MVVYEEEQVMGYYPQGRMLWEDEKGDHKTGWMDMAGPFASPYEAARAMVTDRVPYTLRTWEYRVVRRCQQVVRIIGELPDGSSAE